MKGENFTRIGLFFFGLGLILMIVWVSLYEGEHDPILDGKMPVYSKSSKAVLISGSVLTAVGYSLSLSGFIMTSGLI